MRAECAELVKKGLDVGLDALGDLVELGFGLIIQYSIVENEMDVALGIFSWIHQTMTGRTNLEVLRCPIQVLLQLVVHLHPAHWFLDDLEIVRDLEAVDGVQK